MTSPVGKQRVCPFGAACYRKNPAHFREYAHPSPSTMKEMPPGTGLPIGTGVVDDFLVVPKKHAAAPLTDERMASPAAAAMSTRARSQSPPSRKIPSGPADVAHQQNALSPSKRVSLTLSGSPRATPSKRERTCSAESVATGDVDWAELLRAPAPRPAVIASDVADPSCKSPLRLASIYEMPFPIEDMQALLDVARSLCPENPLGGAFPGWRLVGPFEVLSGTITSFSSDAAKWRYGRFRYDPPEVQTIAVCTVPGISSSSGGGAGGGAKYSHIAFHRDDPKELPTMLVGGRCSKEGDPAAVFDVLGDTLGGVFLQLCSGPADGRGKEALSKVFASPRQRGRSAAETFKLRKKAMLATTVHHLGVVVPYDRKTELGYRPMMMPLAAFKSLITTWNEKGSKGMPGKQLDTITEQFQWADIANDECDFGLNLEIGLNLFSLTVKANDVLYHTWRVLEIVYPLLNRELFRHILKCHLPVLAGTLDVQWRP